MGSSARHGQPTSSPPCIVLNASSMLIHCSWSDHKRVSQQLESAAGATSQALKTSPIFELSFFQGSGSFLREGSPTAIACRGYFYLIPSFCRPAPDAPHLWPSHMQTQTHSHSHSLSHTHHAPFCCNSPH